jgi:hypothetical protein
MRHPSKNPATEPFKSWVFSQELGAEHLVQVTQKGEGPGLRAGATCDLMKVKW